MDDTDCLSFFLHPTQTYHRQYEALRAVFVDGRSQRDVAEEFGFNYNALRQLVSQFRQRCVDGFEPNDSPFFDVSQ